MIIHRIPVALATFVILVGLLTIAGRFFNVDFFSNFNYYWPAMNIVNAICFIASGLIILSIYKKYHSESELAPYFASLLSLVVFLFMATILAEEIFSIPVGIEAIFMMESFGEINRFLPMQPPLLNIFSFILVSFGGFLLLTELKKHALMFLVIGATVSLAGTVAILGHVLGLPYMYFYVVGLSGGTSVLAATLFFLIGISLTIAGMNHKNT